MRPSSRVPGVSKFYFAVLVAQVVVPQRRHFKNLRLLLPVAMGGDGRPAQSRSGETSLCREEGTSFFRVRWLLGFAPSCGTVRFTARLVSIMSSHKLWFS